MGALRLWYLVVLSTCDFRPSSVGVGGAIGGSMGQDGVVVAYSLYY